MTISTLVKIDAIMISYSGTMGKSPALPWAQMLRNDHRSP